jgi:ADP-heptose:LPS heptosyltransferase
VFELVSYVNYGQSRGEVLDLEIWPNRYAEYRSSGKTWTDFIYSHPLIEGADKTNIVFDKLKDEPAEGLPESYNLVAPFGISQGHKRSPFEVIVESRKKLGEKDFYVLCPPEIKINGIECYTAKSVEQMAKAIRGANEFWCIDSAPMALARGVRKEKKVVYYRQTLEPFDKDNNDIWDTVELA